MAENQYQEILHRLALAGIGSCSCVTKTPEISAHAENCPYKFFGELSHYISERGTIPNRDAERLEDDFLHAEASLWRVYPNTHTIGEGADPLEGPGETYRDAYLRLYKRVEELEFRDTMWAQYEQGWKLRCLAAEEKLRIARNDMKRIEDMPIIGADIIHAKGICKNSIILQDSVDGSDLLPGDVISELLEVGRVLYTKNGKVIGNAIVLSVLPHEKFGTVYECQTDFGNKFKVTAKEISGIFGALGDVQSVAHYLYKRKLLLGLESPKLHKWGAMSSAPKDEEVLIKVKRGNRTEILVAHYMPGGHCVEDHPPIDEGWYYWNGHMYDVVKDPECWAFIPEEE